MKSLKLIGFILVTSMGLTMPVFSASHDVSSNTSVDASVIDDLLNNWNNETDILKKSEIAKELQALLGVKTDGLIGPKTMQAIKKAGGKPDFTAPTKEEIRGTKLALKVAEGAITQEEADSITTTTTSIKEIKDKVEASDLTKKEAKEQINTLKSTLPAKAGADDKNDGGNKNVKDSGSLKKSSKKEGRSKKSSGKP